MVSGDHTTDTDAGTVTRLLVSLDAGDHAALDAVFPIVYGELKSIARAHRRRWTGDSTLGTTALVNEAYLKLVESGNRGVRTRIHFLRVASMAMRQILSNYARDRRAGKRGGDVPPVPLDLLGDAIPEIGFSAAQVDTLFELDDALRRLELFDRRLAQVVECRFFGALSLEETAQALGISVATVKRDWALARAWLFSEMHPE